MPLAANGRYWTRTSDLYRVRVWSIPSGDSDAESCTDANHDLLWGGGIMLLSEILDQYVLIRSLSRGASYLLRWSVQGFAGYLGHQATTQDLDDATVSGWLESLDLAPATRAAHRTHLLSLWRFAARRGHCRAPGEVRRERAPEPQPDAWTPEQVRRLIAACQILGRDGEYLRVEILAAYESGIRKSDLHGLRRDQIGETISGYRMTKTGFCHEPQLSRGTVDAILRRAGAYPLACPWGPRKYRQLWARLRDLANVPGRGGCQQLRRTGATWVAVTQGLDAARSYLGHRSPAMVAHYIDRRYYQPRGILPPRVG